MKKDSVACYNIESKIFNSRQGTVSIIEYYDTLNGLWIKLDQYQGLKMCKADSIVFFIVRSEETQRSVMLDKRCSNTGSAMVIGKGYTKRSTSEGKPFTKSSHGEYCT
ncbi:hypothetical protein CR513_25676, partial [Mucuna pruriens]